MSRYVERRLKWRLSRERIFYCFLSISGFSGDGVFFSTFGLLAATNPMRKNPNSHFLTSINAIAGITWENFRFGYSYSFNTSKIGRDGGVYELSISWQGGEGLNCFGCPRYIR